MPASARRRAHHHRRRCPSLQPNLLRPLRPLHRRPRRHARQLPGHSVGARLRRAADLRNLPHHPDRRPQHQRKRDVLRERAGDTRSILAHELTRESPSVNRPRREVPHPQRVHKHRPRRPRPFNHGRRRHSRARRHSMARTFVTIALRQSPRKHRRL